jgi:putative zinc finger protein
MSCKHIQELLPLYVGRDLDEKRERLVATHVESCPACAAEADEYRESRQLLQEFAPPAFSDTVYANMRQNVLRDIKSNGPTFAESVASFFRPRLTRAMATLVLIAFALFGLYFLTNRQPAPNQMVINPIPAVPTVPRESPENKSAPQPSRSDQTDRTAANQPRRQRNYRKAIANESSSVAVNAVKQSPLNRDVSPTMMDSFPPPDEGNIIRVEMQTKDPNIRIIWFSQQNSKPISNSKGT